MWPSLRPEGMRWWAWSLFIPLLHSVQTSGDPGSPEELGRQRNPASQPLQLLPPPSRYVQSSFSPEGLAWVSGPGGLAGLLEFILSRKWGGHGPQDLGPQLEAPGLDLGAGCLNCKAWLRMDPSEGLGADQPSPSLGPGDIHSFDTDLWGAGDAVEQDRRGPSPHEARGGRGDHRAPQDGMCGGGGHLPARGR